MPTIVVLSHLTFLAINLLQDNTASDFQDLGKWLLGGFIGAVALAITFTLIRLRLKNKKPPRQVISIKPVDD